MSRFVSSTVDTENCGNLFVIEEKGCKNSPAARAPAMRKHGVDNHLSSGNEGSAKLLTLPRKHPYQPGAK